MAILLTGCAHLGSRAVDSEQSATRSVVDARWPTMNAVTTGDEAMEARIATIVAGMSLEQKVGQMTQAEIRSITPAQAREHCIGAILNGGGSWPHDDKRASVGEWVDVAERYYEASLTKDNCYPVPILWGTDAVHGHNNVYGATLFPHNIGLGATRNVTLIREIGRATAKAVRATGIQWVFGPTVAIALDPRWGRTYESFSDDPALVRTYAKAYVEGLQDDPSGATNVIATAKHFLGDGATQDGKDQGVSHASLPEMSKVHLQGYLGALSGGVQAVMASLSSWQDADTGTDYGNMHGSRELLTGLLKESLGFDGFVVSDWNGIDHVDGCTKTQCARAIMAGIDMAMVPEDWLQFIANTVAQVRSGEIPETRIDDAVRRILRVKMRAGIFDRKPSQSAYAGEASALQARSLARQAVRESLVLVKNDGGPLPLRSDARVLVAGKSADSIANQSGGWSLSWQGDGNQNSDFPIGMTILDGIRQAAGAKNVIFDEQARHTAAEQFDVAIVVIGETPYAEFNGDIPAAGTLWHAMRHPEDLETLERAHALGRPVIAVFVTGRPAYVNDLMNLSTAFVVAWLPGTEGGGIADVLFRSVDGNTSTTGFVGTLPFPWPGFPCPTSVRWGERDHLWPRGYGLKYGDISNVGTLPVFVRQAGCRSETETAIDDRGNSRYSAYVSTVADGSQPIMIARGKHETVRIPALGPVITVEVADLDVQYDAKRISWLGDATFSLRGERTVNLSRHWGNGVLTFDAVLQQAPGTPIILSIDCQTRCRGIDISSQLKSAPIGQRQSVAVPLSCFVPGEHGLDTVTAPFVLSASVGLRVTLGNIRITDQIPPGASVAGCQAAASYQ